MLNSQDGGTVEFLPEEYRETAKTLFPAVRSGSKELPRIAQALAGLLGIGEDYRKILNIGELRPLGSKPGPEVQHFLHSFQNNLDLLIQKTWVEKNDEDRKEKLQGRIPGLTALIEKADYAAALGEFGAVLEELSWLLFGRQSRKDDFISYVSRIDPRFGLFWWYAGCIDRILAELEDRSVIRMILLLGLCYLTDF